MTIPLPIGAVIRTIGADPATWLDGARQLDEAGRFEEEAMGRYEHHIALLYQDVPQELASEALKRGRRQSKARMWKPSPLAFWPDVPTHVLLCRDDRLFAAASVRRVAQERLGITPDQIDGGHTTALSRPKELAERHEAYAAEASASAG